MTQREVGNKKKRKERNPGVGARAGSQDRGSEGLGAKRRDGVADIHEIVVEKFRSRYSCTLDGSYFLLAPCALCQDMRAFISVRGFPGWR